MGLQRVGHNWATELNWKFPIQAKAEGVHHHWTSFTVNTTSFTALQINIWMQSSKEQQAAAAVKLFQSCLTLCDPIDGSPLGSAVPGILQARTLEWVAISFSNAWKWKVKVKLLSPVWLLVTLAYHAPL